VGQQNAAAASERADDQHARIVCYRDGGRPERGSVGVNVDRATHVVGVHLVRCLSPVVQLLERADGLHTRAHGHRRAHSGSALPAREAKRSRSRARPAQRQTPSSPATSSAGQQDRLAHAGARAGDEARRAPLRARPEPHTAPPRTPEGAIPGTAKHTEGDGGGENVSHECIHSRPLALRSRAAPPSVAVCAHHGKSGAASSFFLKKKNGRDGRRRHVPSRNILGFIGGWRRRAG
jgi:hypothetical protein